MSFNWREYLRLAKELAKQEQDEASQRSAISRAYYAAFHCARIYVQTHNPELVERSGDDHGKVWRYLSAAAKRQEKVAGRSGGSLRWIRNRADYDASGLDFPKDTKDASAEAERILNSLAALTPMH